MLQTLWVLVMCKYLASKNESQFYFSPLEENEQDRYRDSINWNKWIRIKMICLLMIYKDVFQDSEGKFTVNTIKMIS